MGIRLFGGKQQTFKEFLYLLPESDEQREFIGEMKPRTHLCTN